MSIVAMRKKWDTIIKSRSGNRKPSRAIPLSCCPKKPYVVKVVGPKNATDRATDRAADVTACEIYFIDRKTVSTTNCGVNCEVSRRNFNVVKSDRGALSSGEYTRWLRTQKLACESKE